MSSAPPLPFELFLRKYKADAGDDGGSSENRHTQDDVAIVRVESADRRSDVHHEDVTNGLNIANTSITMPAINALANEPDASKTPIPSIRSTPIRRHSLLEEFDPID